MYKWNDIKLEFESVLKENLPKLKSFLKSIKANIEITNSNRGEGTVGGIITKVTPGMEGEEKTNQILQSIKDVLALAKRQ